MLHCWSTRGKLLAIVDAVDLRKSLTSHLDPQGYLTYQHMFHCLQTQWSVLNNDWSVPPELNTNPLDDLKHFSSRCTCPHKTWTEAVLSPHRREVFSPNLHLSNFHIVHHALLFILLQQWFPTFRSLWTIEAMIWIVHYMQPPSNTQ